MEACMYAYTYVHVLYKLVLFVQKHLIHYYLVSLCLVALVVQVHINLGLLPILTQLLYILTNIGLKWEYTVL